MSKQESLKRKINVVGDSSAWENICWASASVFVASPGTLEALKASKLKIFTLLFVPLISSRTRIEIRKNILVRRESGRNWMFQQHGLVMKPSLNVDIQICVKNETSNEKTDVTRDAYIFSVFAIMMRNSWQIAQHASLRTRTGMTDQLSYQLNIAILSW